MENTSKIYNVTIAGQQFKLRFLPEEAPTKMGVKLQFVTENDFADPRDKQDIANKLSVVLQKKFGGSGIAITYNDREAYRNVISFIVPMNSIAELLFSLIKK